MEHQSSRRTELIPEDVAEYFIKPPEIKIDPKPILRNIASHAIDSVRSSGWFNYDKNKEE